MAIVAYRLVVFVFFRVYSNLPRISCTYSGICHIYPGIINSTEWLLLPTGDEVHTLYDYIPFNYTSNTFLLNTNLDQSIWLQKVAKVCHL